MRLFISKLRIDEFEKHTDANNASAKGCADIISHFKSSQFFHKNNNPYKMYNCCKNRISHICYGNYSYSYYEDETLGKNTYAILDHGIYDNMMKNIFILKDLFKSLSKLYKFIGTPLYYDDDKHPLIFNFYYHRHVGYIIKVIFPRNHKHYPVFPGYIVNPSNHRIILYDGRFLTGITMYNKYVKFLSKVKPATRLMDDLLFIIFEYTTHCDMTPCTPFDPDNIDSIINEEIIDNSKRTYYSDYLLEKLEIFESTKYKIETKIDAMIDAKIEIK